MHILYTYMSKALLPEADAESLARHAPTLLLASTSRSVAPKVSRWHAVFRLYAVIHALVQAVSLSLYICTSHTYVPPSGAAARVTLRGYIYIWMTILHLPRWLAHFTHTLPTLVSKYLAICGYTYKGGAAARITLRG